MSAPTYIQAFVEAYGALASSQPTVPAKLWTEQVPEQDAGTYPRVELLSLGDQPLFDKAGPQMRTVRSRLNVFATSAKQVEDMIGDGEGVIGNWFHKDRLSITGKSNQLWPGSYSFGILPERTANGQPIYVGSLEHLCEMF